MAHSNTRPTYIHTHTLSHMPYVTARQSNDTICLWIAFVDLAFRTAFFSIKCWIILSPRGRHKENEKRKRERERAHEWASVRAYVKDRARQARKIIGRWHFKLYLYRNAHTEYRDETKQHRNACTKARSNENINTPIDQEIERICFTLLFPFLFDQHTGFSFNFRPVGWLAGWLVCLFVRLLALLINLLHLFAQNFSSIGD